MGRSFRHALDNIQAALDGIQAATAGKTFDDYRGDWLLRHALQRAIEIISDASRSLPEEIRALRPEVPWPQIRAIGNVLRHECHGVSDQLLWRVMVDDVPPLREAIKAIREVLDRSEEAER